jgi:type IV secretion system protein VirB9
LHLCVIKLMPGESINDISIGDSVRWRVASSRAGDMPVIVLKPAATGLETNLTVLTDAGRVYYMTLRSAARGAVPLIQFFDPQDILIKVNERRDQTQAQARQEQEKRDASFGKLDPVALDFQYICTAKNKAQFKPTEVFSGNGHIYLKMPEDMKYQDAPVVFDTSTDNMQLINSRYARGYEVIDGLPTKFKLVVGVDSDAQTVECAHSTAKTRNNNDTSWFGN